MIDRPNKNTVTRIKKNVIVLGTYRDAEDAKVEKPIDVPLNNEMVLLLRKQIGKHKTFVFTCFGRPLKKANTQVWRNAEITNFRWHDLRHTWASWLIHAGVPPTEVLQEVGAWSDIQMV